MKDKISVIIPVYNEEKNIKPLYNELNEILNSLSYESEIIFIDDGSIDWSYKVLSELAASDNRIKIIKFKRNYGQTAAIDVGFQKASGNILITMDCDLQNDPHDIPKLINLLNEGYDVVSGWRRKRKDNYIKKVLPSNIANIIIGLITRVRLHDFGCTLKAYRKEIMSGIRLYGEMHRFIPVYAFWNGARITEIEVNHRKRIHGASNYGLSRTLKVLLDLLVLKFMGDFRTKPIYFFGFISVISFIIGIVLNFFVVIRKLFFHGYWISPMIIISFFFLIMAVQFLLIGILAEMIMRIFYSTTNQMPVIIENNKMSVRN